MAKHGLVVSLEEEVVRTPVGNDVELTAVIRGKADALVHLHTSPYEAIEDEQSVEQQSGDDVPASQCAKEPAYVLTLGSEEKGGLDFEEKDGNESALQSTWQLRAF